MAQGDYLPGTYSRVGTKENPGTYLGGGSGGTSQIMPPKVKKVWVLDNDRWNMRNYWISGGKFSIPAVWVLTKGVWDNFSGVVDLMGVMFDYPEDKVLSKRWVGNDD